MAAIHGKNYGNPTLDLNFAGNKSLVDTTTEKNYVTFSRAQSGNEATYIGSDGLIKHAAADEARFDHDPVTLESLGLLIEESRTNLFTHSEEFDDATWSKVNATITPNAIAAPDGTTTADNLIANATNSSHFIFEPLAVSSGATTCSIYAKSAGLSWVTINVYDGGAYRKFSFNVSTGEKGIVASGLSSSIEPCANGWYRISCTYVSTGAQNTIHFMLYDGESTENFLGDGTSGIYIWGAQLEAGSFPTSYIPTSGSTVTRAADVASITGTNFSSWYNQSEGSLFINSPGFPQTKIGSNRAFVYISDTTVGALSANDGIKWGVGSADNTSRVYVTEAGANSITAFTIASQSSKFAIGLAPSNGAICSDGSILGTSLSVVMPTGMDRLVFTTAGTASEHISRLTYYPKRLPDIELQQLTK